MSRSATSRWRRFANPAATDRWFARRRGAPENTASTRRAFGTRSCNLLDHRSVSAECGPVDVADLNESGSGRSKFARPIRQIEGAEEALAVPASLEHEFLLTGFQNAH